jgi:hypothetical protein
LKKYKKTGKQLAEQAIMKEIEASIQNHIISPKDESNRGIFFYVEGSSGIGKTQLAFNFQNLRVLYIPLGFEFLCYIYNVH